MLYGNQEAQKILRTYLQQYTNTDAAHAGFFLLYGPQNIGKSSIAYEMIEQLLGGYLQSNLLHIKDFSEILGKKHTIKVAETTDTEDYKTLRDTYQYQDRGVREINLWMQQSGFGLLKIVLIENIERMTTEASNAFLKTCEEPLPHRLIIATTGNKSKVIETIISRSIHVPLGEVSQEDMFQLAKEHQIFLDQPELQKLIVMMAMGRPGAMLSFYSLIDSDEELKLSMKELLSVLPRPGNLHKKQQILNKFIEKGLIEQFLDGRIAYLTAHAQIPQAQKRLSIKKMLQTNVQVENVILYGLLE